MRPELETHWEASSVGCDRDQPRDRLLVHGRNQVEPCDGGIVRTAFGGYTPESTVTTWDPNRPHGTRTNDSPTTPTTLQTAPVHRLRVPHRRARRRQHRPCTLRQAVPPLRRLGSRIRRHDQGQRAVLPHSRRVPNALPRRTATPITASGPTVTDWDHAWTVLHDRQAARLLRPASLWNAFDKNKSASDRLTADLRASRRLPTQH